MARRSYNRDQTLTVIVFVYAYKLFSLYFDGVCVCVLKEMSNLLYFVNRGMICLVYQTTCILEFFFLILCSFQQKDGAQKFDAD